MSGERKEEVLSKDTTKKDRVPSKTVLVQNTEEGLEEWRHWGKLTGDYTASPNPGSMLQATWSMPSSCQPTLKSSPNLAQSSCPQIHGCLLSIK